MTPANGACPNTVATAVFSEAMNPSTIDSSTFTLTGPGTTPVNGQVTYDPTSNTAIFTPASALAPSTTYTSTITTGAADLLGQNLANDFVWTFTTAPTLCQPPLPPSSVSPANESTGICSNTVIAVTFPQAMLPASINSASFKLAGPGVTPVAGTITHDQANKIFVFSPAATLALNTTFTGTITTGAEDMSGNALASDFVWTFTTSPMACAPPPPPAVISVTPPDETAGVCLDSVLTATFNEAMNPATIGATTFTVAGPGVTPVVGVVSLDGNWKGCLIHSCRQSCTEHNLHGHGYNWGPRPFRQWFGQQFCVEFCHRDAGMSTAGAAWVGSEFRCRRGIDRYQYRPHHDCRRRSGAESRKRGYRIPARNPGFPRL